MSEPHPIIVARKAIVVDITISSAIQLAVLALHETTHAMLPETTDTFRILVDSLEFLDEDGSGWELLKILYVSCTDMHWKYEAETALLLWMLKLLSFEVITYGTRSQLASMLFYTSQPIPGLEEASQIILSPNDPEIVNTTLPYPSLRYSMKGHNLLHSTLAYSGYSEKLRNLLSYGPDLHRLSLCCSYTPWKESPTSIALYSSWAFVDWVRGLDSIAMDFEKLVEEELGRNHEVHPGWEKGALLGVYAYSLRLDPKPPTKDNTCSYCSDYWSFPKVQPYWRHLIERFKRRLHPDSTAQACPEAGEKNGAYFNICAGNASSSTDTLAQGRGTTNGVSHIDRNELSLESKANCGSNLDSDCGLNSDSDWEPDSQADVDVHEYPATVSILSDCVYAADEVVCIHCWLHYVRTGTRRPPRDTEGYVVSGTEEDSPSDESSSEEYYPYLIHS